jgi:hypothetical protein
VAVAAIVILAGGGSSGEQANASLAAVPFSRVSDGFGKVVLDLKGDTAKVTLTSKGLLNGKAHLMHIHAGKLGQCPPGSAARRHNGHLVITTEDGAPYYGPVQTSLTTNGPTTPKSLHDFARFPTAGAIDYNRTVNLGPVTAAQVRANQAVIVVHGIDYNRNARYDSVLGTGEGRNVESTAPALCGALKFKGSNAQSAKAGGGMIFAATLGPARDGISSSIASLFCGVPGEPQKRQ